MALNLSLNLSGLTEKQRQVLGRLRASRVAYRATLAEKTGLTRNQVSCTLNRLESFGLVEKTDLAAWKITAAGDALYPKPAAAHPEPTGVDPIPMSEHEPAAESIDPTSESRAEIILVEPTPDPARTAILEELSRFPRSQWPDFSFDVWVLEQVAAKIAADMPQAAAHLRIISEKIGAFS